MMSSKSGFQLFCPISKVEKKPDGTVWAMGWGSVSDYRDDQNEIVDPAAMRKAVEDWAPWGNIRLQHDASKPVGVCPEGNWAIKSHPETGTDALWLNTHIVEPTACKMLEEGVLKGFSIGGVCLERVPELVKNQDGTEGRAYRLKRFKLSEISLVDKPACDLATVERVEIAKRAHRAEEETLQLNSREVGVLRGFFSRLFGRGVEKAADSGDVSVVPLPRPLLGQGEATVVADSSSSEGRAAADGSGMRRPADGSGKAAGLPLAKLLGAIVFLSKKLDLAGKDLEDIAAAASVVNSTVLVDAIDEVENARNRARHTLAKIMEETSGEMAAEEEHDIVMDAATVMKAITDAAEEGDLRKVGRAISAANAAHLAKSAMHLDKAAFHHARLGSELDEMGKCYKAAGAGVDEASEHLAKAKEYHEAIGEHQELAKMHLSKVGGSQDEEAGPDDLGSEPSGEIEDLTVDEMIAAALGTGNLRKRGTAKLFSEMIALIRKNAELEAHLAMFDNTPARPKARLFAVHKGDESRALMDQAGGSDADVPEAIDPNDRDAFKKAYRRVFANPRSIRDPRFKGSAGGAL